MRITDDRIKAVLDDALQVAKKHNAGEVAAYIPELAAAAVDFTGVALAMNDGRSFSAGDNGGNKFTLQSAAKLVLLIGLLEELGFDEVYNWVHVEPSGDDFASVARLDQFGPYPYNPMLNSGAIALCDHIAGTSEERLQWLETWMEKLFGEPLTINQKVFASENRTGDRNRSLAYLLKNNKIIKQDVKGVLETYFYLCSFEAAVKQAAYLPMLLANDGKTPDGKSVISLRTVQQVVAIMATCGLYNESGSHLVRTGLPAKSSVSGFILAVARGFGGFAVFSPRVTRKGTSVRGEIILEHISRGLNLHFAG